MIIYKTTYSKLNIKLLNFFFIDTNWFQRVVPWERSKETVFWFYEEQIQNKECHKLLKTAQKTVSIGNI